MAGATMNVRDFILGLLVRQPMSGYDIKSLLESLSWLIDVPSYGSVYPALHALLEDGFVSVEVVTSPDKPPKKVYSATEEGERALQEWLAHMQETEPSLKSFLMRLFLADNFSHTGLITHLNRRRLQVKMNHSAFEKLATAEAGDGDLGERLVRDYSLAIANAELDWLENVLERLS